MENQEVDNKFDQKEKNEIKYLSELLSISKTETEKMYLHFNKNLKKCLDYYNKEIENIKIISSQLDIGLDDAKNLYYDNNRDTVSCITNYLNNSNNKLKKKEEKILPVFNPENKNIEYIFEQGKELVLDKNNGEVFDHNDNYKYLGNIEIIRNKNNIFKNLRNIADNKDKIMNNYLKLQKKERYVQSFDEDKKILEKWVEEKIDLYNNSEEFRKQKKEKGISNIKEYRNILMKKSIDKLYSKYKHAF